MSDDNFDVPVLVHIPRRRYKTLNREALKRNTTVGHLVRALLITSVPETDTTQTVNQVISAERDAYITRRNSEGASDGEIARELGQSHGGITRRRARLGLPANRRVGGQPIEEASA